MQRLPSCCQERGRATVPHVYSYISSTFLLPVSPRHPSVITSFVTQTSYQNIKVYEFHSSSRSEDIAAECRPKLQLRSTNDISQAQQDLTV
jgi:hypothetical protein